MGHIHRIRSTVAIRRVKPILVEGAMRSGQSRRKWEYSVRLDMKELALSEHMVLNRRLWRSKIRIVE